MQQSNQNKSSEKHIFSEQTSNKYNKFRLKHLHISCDTNEIMLHVIKQCLQTVRRCTQATRKRHSNHQSTN